MRSKQKFGLFISIIAIIACFMIAINGGNSSNQTTVKTPQSSSSDLLAAVYNQSTSEPSSNPTESIFSTPTPDLSRSLEAAETSPGAQAAPSKKAASSPKKAAPSTKKAVTAPPVDTPAPPVDIPAPTMAPPEPTENKQSYTVYITETGKKYHRAGCQYLSQSCIPIDLDRAIGKGYTPCSKCDP